MTVNEPSREGTGNTKEIAMSNEKPWNSWRGLHEGEMLEELVEHDHVRFGIPVAEAREALETYDNEALRKAWWDAIGRWDDTP